MERLMWFNIFIFVLLLYTVLFIVRIIKRNNSALLNNNGMQHKKRKDYKVRLISNEPKRKGNFTL